MKNFRTILLITVLSLSVTPFLVKFLYGTPLFGMTVNEKSYLLLPLLITKRFSINNVWTCMFYCYERRYRCRKIGNLVAFRKLEF